MGWEDESSRTEPEQNLKVLQNSLREGDKTTAEEDQRTKPVPTARSDMVIGLKEQKKQYYILKGIKEQNQGDQNR